MKHPVALNTNANKPYTTTADFAFKIKVREEMKIHLSFRSQILSSCDSRQETSTSVTIKAFSSSSGVLGVNRHSEHNADIGISIEINLNYKFRFMNNDVFERIHFQFLSSRDQSSFFRLTAKRQKYMYLS